MKNKPIIGRLLNYKNYATIHLKKIVKDEMICTKWHHTRQMLGASGVKGWFFNYFLFEYMCYIYIRQFRYFLSVYG